MKHDFIIIDDYLNKDEKIKPNYNKNIISKHWEKKFLKDMPKVFSIRIEEDILKKIIMDKRR